MQLHSKQFQDSIRQLLLHNTRLVGSITSQMKSIPLFCQEVIAVPGVKLYHVTASNREQVLDEILHYMEENWIRK
jgi:nucleoside-triphosphatase THEP1